MSKLFLKSAWKECYTKLFKILNLKGNKSNDKGEETLQADGSKVTTYLDGRVETTFPGGKKSIQYPDGEIMTISVDGHKVIKHLDDSMSSNVLGRENWTRYYPGRRAENVPRPEKDKIK